MEENRENKAAHTNKERKEGNQMGKKDEEEKLNSGYKQKMQLLHKMIYKIAKPHGAVAPPRCARCANHVDAAPPYSTEPSKAP